MSKIPKVIHYCWFGENDLSEKEKYCIESWKNRCPDYEIKLWNEKNIDVMHLNQYVKEAYENKKYAFVSDYVRLYVIYQYGGIYLDTDVELLKSLDKFLCYDSFFSFENDTVINTGVGFGAKKGNEVIKKMLDDYQDIPFVLKNGHFDIEPCTVRNTNAIKSILKSFSDRTVICNYQNNYFFPTEYFCPMSNVTGKINITENTVSIHHYSGSWLDKKGKRNVDSRRMLCSIFGEKIGSLLSRVMTFPYRVNNKIKKYGFFGMLNFAFQKVFIKNKDR